jgi:hypothetical protein
MPTAAGFAAPSTGRRCRSVLAACAALASMTAAAIAVASPGRAAAVTVSNWMISSRSIGLINGYTGSTALATGTFDSASTLEIGTPARGWVTQRTTTYTFYGPVSKTGSFLYALKHKTVPAGTTYVMLDMESWAATPHQEQVTPKVYMAEFVSAARKHGYQPVLAPSISLTTGMTCSRNTDTAWKNYLVNCRVPTIVAQALPAVYEIQAQRYEADTSTGTNCGCYQWFTRQAAAQAQAVTPGLDVRAGLSTNPSGHVSTGQTLFTDTLNTQAFVNGYWLNLPQQGTSCPSCVPDGAPQVAVSYLQLLSGPEQD